jgi:hypothetical protein
MHVPSPAEPTPPGVPTAVELVAYIREHDGRVLRMQAENVICLTHNHELVGWLLEHGARQHSPRIVNHYDHDVSLGSIPAGGYRRAHDSEQLEWDLSIHPMAVSGEQTIWDAAAR